ncbi:MAG: TIGR02147 family protein [Deltaproteobacteria bacterium]|nr:TIGR02147 family protein [Deltaproteobacteria bacterium]MBI4223354.1 TIGR02147 family protein [Deltaproteobacteria bacterium]
MYTDHRKYLEDRYKELKATQAAFSYRYFSKKAGFASPNFLKLVMDGKRNLSAESIYKFADALKLNKKEKRFFEILVQYNQSTDPRQKEHYYLQMLEFPEYRKVYHLEQEQYEYLSRWYYPAILEMTRLADFEEDPRWIADKLNKKVSVKEVKEALELLRRIGLLTAEGKAAHKALTTGEIARSLAAFAFHEQVLDQAKQALKEQSVEQREFAAMTVAINETQLKRLKEMIHDFRKHVLNFLSQETEAPDRVCQFSAQLFLLTEGEAKEEEKESAQ